MAGGGISPAGATSPVGSRDRKTACYRPIPELRAKLGGILRAGRVITYCSAGAAAARIADVLVKLGHPNVAIYNARLMEWCADRSVALEVGA